MSTWLSYVAIGFLSLVALGLLAMACEGISETRERTASRPTAVPVPTATPTPTVSIGEIVVSQIMEYPRVRDAAIKQDGRQLSLVLVVDYATSPDYAMELGDNFVRITKSLIGDGKVGQSIGKGEMDYIIGVYYPNESRVVVGAKARSSDRIRW